MGVFDVPAGKLIDEVAKSLQTGYSIEQPSFTEFTKTGAHTERTPQRKDWFYVRMASLLYRLYKDGPNGVGSFRTYYGGKKNRGVKPHRFRKASGKVIRSALQSLEKAGLVEKAERGRRISKKGHSFLVKKAKETEKALLEEARKQEEITALPQVSQEQKPLEQKAAEAQKGVKAPEQEPQEQKAQEQKREEAEPKEGEKGKAQEQKLPEKNEHALKGAEAKREERAEKKPEEQKAGESQKAEQKGHGKEKVQEQKPQMRAEKGAREKEEPEDEGAQKNEPKPESAATEKSE